MTIDITLEPPRQARPADAVTNRGASYLVASSQVAGRTLKKFVRTPALIIAGTAQGRQGGDEPGIGDHAGLYRRQAPGSLWRAD